MGNIGKPQRRIEVLPERSPEPVPAQPAQPERGRPEPSRQPTPSR